MLEKFIGDTVQDNPNQTVFDPLSNVDWNIESAWGQRYITQFDITTTSVEDLSDLLWLGIIKRRLWLLEADKEIKKWNDRHPSATIPTPSLDEVSKSPDLNPEAVRMATVMFPAFLVSYGFASKNRDLVRITLPLFILGEIVSSNMLKSK